MKATKWNIYNPWKKKKILKMQINKETNPTFKWEDKNEIEIRNLIESKRTKKKQKTNKINGLTSRKQELVNKSNAWLQI